MQSKMINSKVINKILLVSVFLIALSLIIGCNGAVETDKDNSGTEKSSEKIGDKGSELGKTAKATKLDEVKVAEEIDMALYFVGEQGESLIKTVVRTEKTESIAKAAIEGLISGPATTDSYRSVPVGTKLISISVDGGKATVDLSKEFIDGHGGGSAEEMMSVYSIVNTLTEFSTIDSVIFKVEGKKISTISGHLDISDPVQRREDLIAP